ncbi:hypothetical protein OS493_006928 [Desmophyllum pertusum]|uniref:Uncharacterized protein n=1 Tax=Desmophyllum pertusum TaxID=174260 RepID=A0A9X0D6P3_9CNID|nr:hypothetical protein OS493_006928 [Desmophyllum pertusum]
MRKMCLKYFLRISGWKGKRKKCNGNKIQVLKDDCKVFKNKNHHSLHQKIKVSNDIEINPGPTFLYYDGCNTVRGTFHQGDEELFGINAGKQCVANSLVAVVFNEAASCFVEQWDS